MEDNFPANQMDYLRAFSVFHLVCWNVCVMVQYIVGHIVKNIGLEDSTIFLEI